MEFGKADASQGNMTMNESMLDYSGTNSMLASGEEAKNSARGQNPSQLQVDPNSIFDPKYILHNTEMKKIENLQTLLAEDNQLFLLNLCQGIKDPRQLKKSSKSDLEKIKEEQDQMIILALRTLKHFSFDEVESSFNILQFMSESVLPYLFNDNP